VINWFRIWFMGYY